MTEGSIADDVLMADTLTWYETVTPGVMNAATIYQGFTYNTVFTPDGLVSWNSPFDDGDWKYVSDLKTARSEAQSDYSAFLKANPPPVARQG